MKRHSKTLKLKKETLRRLGDETLRGIGGGESIQSGETYCWCTDTCDCGGTIAR